MDESEVFLLNYPSGRGGRSGRLKHNASLVLWDHTNIWTDLDRDDWPDLVLWSWYGCVIHGGIYTKNKVPWFFSIVRNYWTTIVHVVMNPPIQQQKNRVSDHFLKMCKWAQLMYYPFQIRYYFFVFLPWHALIKLWSISAVVKCCKMHCYSCKTQSTVYLPKQLKNSPSSDNNNAFCNILLVKCKYARYKVHYWLIE